MTGSNFNKHVSYGFGQWLVVSLAVLVLGTFPMVGSADNNSYIFGVVFTDTNNNGIHDAGEPVLSNHDLYLEDLTLINKGEGGNFNAVTGADGKFVFVVQSIGDYNISTDLNDMQLTAPFSAEGFMPPYKLSITEKGQIIKINFGLSNNTIMDTSSSQNTSTNTGELRGLLGGQILHLSCNGEVNDQSNLKHSVENKGVTLVSDKLGHRGRACFFDGSDYLRIPKHSAFNLSSFTIATWVLVEGAYNGVDTRAIVSNDSGSGSQRYGINMAKGVAGAFYDNGNSLGGAKDVDSPTNLANGEWHHVAAVFEGGVKTKLYVDGVAKRQSDGVMPASINPTGDLFIGRGGISESMEKRWVGSMDDVRVLNRALSGDEINQLLGIIDLPTGETFTPLGVKEGDPFVVSVKNGSISPIMVTPNPDGGYSLKVLPSNLRAGNRAQPSETSTFIMNPDGGVTLLDEAAPGVVANLNIFGDLEVTDTKVPDLKLILQKNSNRFAFQSISDPSVVVRVNHDGTLDIVDETKPNVSVVRHKDRTYTVVDQEAKTITWIDRSGNAVLRHSDYPNVAATFNVFASQGEYALVDLDSNECLQMNADGSIGNNLRSNFFKKALGVVGGAITNGVKSAISTMTSNAFQQTVGAVVSGGAAILGSAALGAMTGLACWLPCLPAIAPFAIAGVVALGVVVGVVAIVSFFKKQKKQIEGLRMQIQQLAATIHQQTLQIQRLEATVITQAQTIQRLEATVAELQQNIAQQKQQIDEQAQKTAALEDQAAKQAEASAKQAEMNAALQQKLANLEENLTQANEGVEQIPDGEAIDPNTRSRHLKSSQCNTLIKGVREILGIEQVEPVAGQAYVVDNGLTILGEGPYSASGTIKDKLGPIAGVTVQIAGKTATTDATGNWQITGLTAGNYTAEATQDGYLSLIQQFEVSEAMPKANVPLKLTSLLKVQVSTQPKVAKQNDNVTYLVNVTNNGTRPATGLVLKDLIPAGTTTISMEGDHCNTNTVSCTLPDLAPGNTAKVKLIVNAPQAGNQANTAQITANNYPADSLVTVKEILPTLSALTNCTPNPVPMLTGLHCVVEVNLSQYATAPATGLKVVTTLPNGVELQTAKTDFGTCDTTQLPKVTCALNDLPNGTTASKATLNFDMTLKDAGLLVLTQETTVSSDNYGSHLSRARTTIKIPSDLQVDLALVIDITGSMQGEIDGVKAALKKFIATLDPTASPLVALLVFKDDVTVKAFTKDMNVLLKAIEALKADGGGTCPEASVEAVELAAHHVKPGGQIWFTTDASPYADADVQAVLDLLQSKNIRFNATVTGDCTTAGSANDDQWQQVVNGK
jgi:uncharacterized repeat protein (TIGR01451 family)